MTDTLDPTQLGLGRIDPHLARRAALAICARAHDTDDARRLLQALGLVAYRRAGRGDYGQARKGKHR